MRCHTTIDSIIEQGRSWPTSSGCRPTLRSIISCLIVFRSRWKFGLLSQILLIIYLWIIGVVDHSFVMPFRTALTSLLSHWLDLMTWPWWNTSWCFSINIVNHFGGHSLEERSKFANSVISLLENGRDFFLFWFRVHVIPVTTDSVSSGPLNFFIQLIIEVGVLILLSRIRYPFSCKFGNTFDSLSLDHSISLSLLFIFSLMVKSFLLSVSLRICFLVVILIL
jgi:hypothetical protein